METVGSVCAFLDEFAPPGLAEEWDNTGLLVGDKPQAVSRVMTCLTLTPASVAEAIENHAQLVVAHHPLPFQPLKRITTESTPGRLLWQLMRAGVAIYSPHTAFDSAAAGINEQLAKRLGLGQMAVLVPQAGGPANMGAGRKGQLAAPMELAALAAQMKREFALELVQYVGSPTLRVRQVAVACGAAGQFLAAARGAGCEAFITGETNFHTCLEAEATGMGLILMGHYASERFAVEQLANVLAGKFPSLDVWASRQERNPLCTLS